MTDTQESRDFNPSARLIIAVLVTALGVLVTFVAVLFIRLDHVITDVKAESECNTNWKAAYVAALTPRLKASLAQLESTRTFYDALRDLNEGGRAGAERTSAERRQASRDLDAALDAAYDQVSDQITTIQTFTYPSDPCGEDTSLGTPEPLPKTKETDDASRGEAPLGGSSSGGGGGAVADGNVGVDRRPSKGGNGGSGGGGGSGGNPGAGPLVPDDVEALAQSVVCSISRPVRSFIRFPGCVAD